MYLKLLRQLIRENIELEKIAFGSKRKDEIPFEEEDTTSESILLKNILAYLKDNMQPTKEQALTIKKFLATKKYPDMFSPPHVETIYRSISVNPEEISQITGIDKDRFDMKFGKENVNIFITPRNGYISSWSSNFSSALNFGRNLNLRAQNKEDIIIVFEAKTSNNHNLLDIQNFYDKIDNPLMQTIRNEKEIWAIGPVKISLVKWYRQH